MIRGTTPPITLYVEGYDLTGKTVEIYLKCIGKDLIEKTGDDLEIAYENEESVIQFSLSQEETLAMRTGFVTIQVRWIDADGLALATEMATRPVGDILKPEIIEYRGE